MDNWDFFMIHRGRSTSPMVMAHFSSVSEMIWMRNKKTDRKTPPPLSESQLDDRKEEDKGRCHYLVGSDNGEQFRDLKSGCSNGVSQVRKIPHDFTLWTQIQSTNRPHWFCVALVRRRKYILYFCISLYRIQCSDLFIENTAFTWIICKIKFFI